MPKDKWTYKWTDENSSYYITSQKEFICGDIATEAKAKSICHCVNNFDDMVKLCEASFHALRSYQFGNCKIDLAKEVADKIESALQKAKGE